MLNCANNSYYTGYTVNLPRRLRQHRGGGAAAKYTRGFGPVGIASCWRLFGARGEALRVEAAIKRMKRPAKEELVRDPSRLKGLLAESGMEGTVIVPLNSGDVMGHLAQNAKAPGRRAGRATVPLLLGWLFMCAWVCLSAPRPLGAMAVPELVGDRPDFTESARSVPFGSVQLETGYLYTQMEEEKEHTLGEILVRGAITGWMELRLGFDSFVIRDRKNGGEEGKNEGYAGLKIAFLKSRGSFTLWQPDLALIVGTSIPAGDPDYQENVYQPEAVLALAWPLTDWMSLGMNLNYGWMSEENKRYSRYAGSASLGFSPTRVLGFYIEYYGYYPGSRNGAEIHYINGGLTLLVLKNLQLDARVGRGSGDGREELYAGGGAVVRFLNLY